jgi:hypothetical protein
MLIAKTSYLFVLNSNGPLFSFSDRIASNRFTLATLGAIRSEAVVWPCNEEV